jgi:hypothetical protein
VGSSSKKPKQQVADYLMSLHAGVCHTVDAIKRIRVNEKDGWSGKITSNTTLNINLPSLFGGNKKEGGLVGLVEVLFGNADQVLPDRLIAKMGQGADGTPGFRGITSLFFTGGGAESAAGFRWSSNSPYMRPVDVTVQRAPKGFYPAKALIPAGVDVAATTELIARHTSTYSAAGPVRTPQVAFITSDQVHFHVSQWTSASPTLPTSWNKYDFSRQGFGAASSVLEYGPVDYDPPEQGTSDRADAFWASRFDISGSNTYPAGASGAVASERGGICAGIYSNQLFLKLPPTAPPGAIPTNVSAQNARTVAVGPDGKVYTVQHSETLPIVTIRVYSGTTLELLNTVTLGGFATNGNYLASAESGVLYILRRGNNYYPGSSIFHTGLWTVDLSTWTSSGPFLLPATLTGTVTNEDFRVFGDTVVRGYSDYNTRTMYAEWIRMIPPVYTRADANPAHIIFECLTNNDWGIGLPSAMLDIPSFVAAADILYDEALGLSMMWSTQTNIESFVNDVLGHIDGTYGVDPQTGKIYLSLIRGGYSTGDLFRLTPDNCTLTRFQRKSLSETINEVVVTWTNPLNEQEETVTVHDLANYSSQGVLNSSSSNYYGVRSAELATRLALRDLSRAAAPMASFEADVDRSGWSVKPGDPVLLTYPEYGISELPVRVTSVNYGRPGASKVQITMVEDVFSTPSTAYVDISGSLNEGPSTWNPAPLTYFLGGSAPYYFVSREIGSSAALAMDASEAYMALLGAANGISGIEVLTPTTDALGYTVYENQGSIEPAGRAATSSALALEAISTGVTFTGITGSVSPVAGLFLWIGSGDPATSELAVISEVGSGLTLKRGLLDTTPKAWPAGTTVWLITPGSDITDPDLRLAGQTVSYKLLPRSPRAILDESWAPVVTATSDDRQHLPYRPANVTINGSYWPSQTMYPLVVAFARRNRITEEPVVRSWTDADVTPEAGQTVTATLRRVDTNAVLAETTGITGTSVSLDSTYSGEVTLTLTSVRDGLSSYQPFVHRFTLTALRKTETGETRILESGETRILEN